MFAIGESHKLLLLEHEADTGKIKETLARSPLLR